VWGKRLYGKGGVVDPWEFERPIARQLGRRQRRIFRRRRRLRGLWTKVVMVVLILGALLILWALVLAVERFLL